MRRGRRGDSAGKGSEFPPFRRHAAEEKRLNSESSRGEGGSVVLALACTLKNNQPPRACLEEVRGRELAQPGAEKENFRFSRARPQGSRLEYATLRQVRDGVEVLHRREAEVVREANLNAKNAPMFLGRSTRLHAFFLYGTHRTLFAHSTDGGRPCWQTSRCPLAMNSCGCRRESPPPCFAAWPRVSLMPPSAAQRPRTKRLSAFTVHQRVGADSPNWSAQQQAWERPA